MFKLKSLLVGELFTRKLFINFIFMTFCLSILPLQANFFGNLLALSKNGVKNIFQVNKNRSEKASTEIKAATVVANETSAKSNLIKVAKITAGVAALFGLIYIVINVVDALSRRGPNNGPYNRPHAPYYPPRNKPYVPVATVIRPVKVRPVAPAKPVVAPVATVIRPVKVRPVAPAKPVVEPVAPVVVPAVVIKDPKECPVCIEDREKTDFHKMSCCGLEMCLNCLDDNVVRLAIKEKDIDYLKCPNKACNHKLGIEELRAIVKNDKIKLDAIDEILLEKSLLEIPGIRRCPTEGCKNCFENEENAIRPRRCEQCDQSYCGNCLIDHTRKITCEQALQEAKQKKREKLSPEELERLKKEEEETAKIVRPCPGCKIDIHRTEGCRAMRCDKCKTEFCWNCLEIVDDHTYGHNCPKAPLFRARDVWGVN